MPARQKKAEGDKSSKNLRDKSERFEAQADYFQYDRAGPYWDYVNAEIVVSAVGGFLNAKADGAELLADAEGDRSGSWSLRVEEHYGSGDLVSLRFNEYADYGGAHQSGGTYTKNFADGGRLALSDVFGHDSDVLEFLKEHCEADVKRQLKASGEDGSSYDLDAFLESAQDPWELFAQWNFSPKGLLITLSVYSGLPHAMGEFDVLIPWDSFKDKVSERYAKTPIGRLIASGVA